MTNSTFQDLRALGVDIERAGDAEELALTQLGLGLKSGAWKIYFCAAEFDLQTFHRFTHIADTFVLVDPRKTKVDLAFIRQSLCDQQTAAGDGLVAVG